MLKLMMCSTSKKKQSPNFLENISIIFLLVDSWTWPEVRLSGDTEHALRLSHHKQINRNWCHTAPLAINRKLWSTGVTWYCHLAPPVIDVASVPTPLPPAVKLTIDYTDYLRLLLCICWNCGCMFQHHVHPCDGRSCASRVGHDRTECSGASWSTESTLAKVGCLSTSAYRRMLAISWECRQSHENVVVSGECCSVRRRVRTTQWRYSLRVITVSLWWSERSVKDGITRVLSVKSMMLNVAE